MTTPDQFTQAVGPDTGPRGGALTEHSAEGRETTSSAYAHLFDAAVVRVGWHVLWTRSNFERIVAGELEAKGYEVFLPMVTQWTNDGRGGRRRVQVPMFRGYLFLRHAVDKDAYIDISKSRGLVSILGARWDRLAYVPDREVESIRLAVQSRLPALPYPYLTEGDRVRLTRGSLAGAEGILVKNEAENGLLVISVNLLRRSVAVEVDCTQVVPA